MREPWELELERELERRWRNYKRARAYRYALGCTICGALVAAWAVYWIGLAILHR